MIFHGEKLSNGKIRDRPARSRTGTANRPQLLTKAVIDIAAPLGIAVHDHIIVGRNGYASMKGLRLI
jgi:DNA repair protein RadC